MELRMIPNCSWLKESGFTREQEIDIYNQQLQELYDDPSWYLANLDYMTEYRVSWGTYTTKNITIPK